MKNRSAQRVSVRPPVGTIRRFWDSAGFRERTRSCCPEPACGHAAMLGLVRGAGLPSGDFSHFSF